MWIPINPTARRTKLSTNLTATLTYGLSDNKKTAGVYTIAGSANPTNARVAIPQSPAEDNVDQPAQMISQISTHINGEAVKLRVVSNRRDEYVEYDFQFLEGKPTAFALNVQPRLFKYFGRPQRRSCRRATGVLKLLIHTVFNFL